MQNKYSISTDNKRIFYSIQKGDDEVLFFVHGLGGSVQGWEKMLPYLKKCKHTLIFIDIRGHGFSDKPTEPVECSMRMVAKDIVSILDKENIDKITLVGHSYGSLFLPTFFDMYPDRLKRLVFISSTPSMKHKIYQRVGVGGLYYLILILDKIPITQKLLTGKGEHISINHVKRRHDFSIYLYLKDVKQVGLPIYKYFMKNVKEHNKSLVIEKIDVPTLIIHGKSDKLIPKSRAEELNNSIKDSKLVLIENMNHFPVFNSPKEVVEEITKFIKETK